jgi:phenylacetate-CoA ligase
MDKIDLERLKQVIRHAYSKAPMVKTIFDEAHLAPSDIEEFSDLDKIPVTSKDKLIELQQESPPFGGFLAVSMGELQHVFLSPGPLYEPDAGESAALDSIRNMLAIAGFVPGDRVLNCFGYHYIPTGVMVDKTLMELGITVIPAGVGNSGLQIKMMKDLKVTGYLGTPSWLMALLQEIKKAGLDFNEDYELKKVLVSAEPLPQSLRQTFVEEYSLEVTNAYGTAESGFLAYDREGGLAMHLLENSIIQVVNPDTGLSVNPGEVGEVVVTTLDEVYPLIRLGTGDLVVNIDPSPGKSRQKERSIILVGRVGEAVKVRGMFVHPNQLRFAASQILGVGGIQAIVSQVEHRDNILLKVIPSEEDLDRETLSISLKQAVLTACRVNVDQVEFVSEKELGEDQRLIIDQRIWE